MADEKATNQKIPTSYTFTVEELEKKQALASEIKEQTNKLNDLLSKAFEQGLSLSVLAHPLLFEAGAPMVKVRASINLSKRIDL